MEDQALSIPNPSLFKNVFSVSTHADFLFLHSNIILNSFSYFCNNPTFSFFVSCYAKYTNLCWGGKSLQFTVHLNFRPLCADANSEICCQNFLFSVFQLQEKKSCIQFEYLNALFKKKKILPLIYLLIYQGKICPLLNTDTAGEDRLKHSTCQKQCSFAE